MSLERSRSWRRFKDRINRKRATGSDEPCKPEKKWKHMYLRKEKLARAKQLGMEYPRKRGKQLLDKELPLNE